MKNNAEVKNDRSTAITRMRNNTPPEVKLAVKAKMRLAAHIDDLITAKGWSKTEFARQVDKNPSEITKWLSGTHNFTQDTLAKIAAVLDVDAVEKLYDLQDKIGNVVTQEAKLTKVAKGESRQDDGFCLPSHTNEQTARMRIIHIKTEKRLLKIA